MKRTPGYYRVKDNNEWIIAQWIESDPPGWQIPGSELLWKDVDFEEISDQAINAEPNFLKIRMEAQTKHVPEKFLIADSQELFNTYIVQTERPFALILVTEDETEDVDERSFGPEKDMLKAKLELVQWDDRASDEELAEVLRTAKIWYDTISQRG